MDKKKNINIEFDLLENGLDFIENSLIAILSTDEPQKLKYAILHISAGIELILKEILRLEHWSLLFENIKIQSISDNSQELYKSIRRESSKFIEFVDLVRVKLKNTLLELEIRKVKLIDCPECYQDLFPLDGSNTCLFCGYTDTPENIAELYAENILNYSSYYAYKFGEDCPIMNCPSCGNETLLKRDNTAFCITCDSEWEMNDLSYCSNCGELYEIPSDDHSDYGVCSDCWQN